MVLWKIKIFFKWRQEVTLSLILILSIAITDTYCQVADRFWRRQETLIKETSVEQFWPDCVRYLYFKDFLRSLSLLPLPPFLLLFLFPFFFLWGKAWLCSKPTLCRAWIISTWHGNWPQKLPSLKQMRQKQFISRGRLASLIEKEQVGYWNSAAARKYFLGSMGQACMGN